MTYFDLNKIENEVKEIIIGFYAPPSTRWRRNYTDRADWYWLWNIHKGLLD